MSKHKDKTPAVTESAKALVAETTAAATAATEASAKKAESIGDDVFDTVTAWAAKGLVAAKRGLEASARWLEGRAKTVGELATKLEA